MFFRALSQQTPISQTVFSFWVFVTVHLTKNGLVWPQNAFKGKYPKQRWWAGKKVTPEKSVGSQEGTCQV